MEQRQGLIQVYTGNGKGKTTAALGLAVRALGHGFSVLMIQFMKGDPKYGEVEAMRRFPGFTLVQSGRDVFVDFDNPAQVDIVMARAGWEQAKQAMTSGEHDLVILDELNVAVYFRLIPEGEVVAALKGKHPAVEVVLTGRYAAASLLELAHLVTEMREIKHPYQAGIAAREGIEY